MTHSPSAMTLQTFPHPSAFPPPRPLRPSELARAFATRQTYCKWTLCRQHTQKKRRKIYVSIPPTQLSRGRPSRVCGISRTMAIDRLRAACQCRPPFSCRVMKYLSTAAAASLFGNMCSCTGSRWRGSINFHQIRLAAGTLQRGVVLGQGVEEERCVLNSWKTQCFENKIEHQNKKNKS